MAFPSGPSSAYPFFHLEAPQHSPPEDKIPENSPLNYGLRLFLSILRVLPWGLRPTGTHLSTKVMSDHPRGNPRARMDFPASIERI